MLRRGSDIPPLQIQRHFARHFLRNASLLLCAFLLFFGPVALLIKQLSSSANAAEAISITSITPDSGPTTGGTTVTINGTNFQNDKIKKVATGGEHTCALTIAGKAYCWGLNGSGQLGNGTTTNSGIPVQVSTSSLPNNSVFLDISAKGDTTCGVITGGKAYCWGYNANGQIGDNTTTSRNVPTAVSVSGVLSGKTITSIEIGSSKAAGSVIGTSVCALSSDGKMFCWGYNNFGGLGDGTNTERHVPVAVVTSGVLNGKTIKSIANAGPHACAIDTAGGLYCWGYNSVYGAVGDGTTIDRFTPVAVATTGKQAADVKAAPDHTCALTTDNTPYCWGYNNFGQLGDGTTTQRTTPTAVKTSAALAGKTVVAMSAGGATLSGALTYNTSCAVTSDGGAYCWGNNNYNQLGDGTGVTSRSEPTAVPLGAGKKAVSIDEGSLFTCVVNDDSTINCWGYNSARQLGDNTTTTRALPVIADTSSFNYEQTAVTFGSTPSTNVTFVDSTKIVAIAPPHVEGSVDVTVQNPGSTPVTTTNAFYYGVRPPTISSVFPNSGSVAGGTSVTVTGENFMTSKIKKVATGLDTTACALAANHDVYCWGYNDDYGQLGSDTTITDSNIPLKIKMTGTLSGTTITDLDSGLHFSCVVASSKPYCWGDNNYKQLGNGSGESYSKVPVAVDTSGALSGKTVTKIATGYYHACVIASGQAYCWGDNSHGGLGNNSTTSSSVPVAVDTSGALSGKTVTDISVGQYYTCAVADSKVYCWGYGEYSRLGIGWEDNNDKLTPVAVPTNGTLNGKNVTSVSLGESHGCVIANGLPYCWGNNWAGQIGNNSTTQAQQPVAVVTSGVLNGKTISELQAGPYQTCVIASGQEYCWGYNEQGQLGDGTTTDRHTPVAIALSGPMNGKTVTNLGGGSEVYSCSVADDAIYCWGANWDGNLGNNTYINSTTPVATVMTSFTNTPPMVYFDSLPATNVTFINSTTLTAITPAHAAGFANVKITNGDHQSNTKNNAYHYLAAVSSSPTNLTTTPAQNAVNLSWVAPTNDGGAAITDYKIEYMPDGGNWLLYNHTASNETATTITGLQSNIIYSFRVSAINAAGTSAPSNVATGTPIYIMLNGSGSVAIDMIPQGAQTISSSQHTLTLDTNNPTGFSLTLEMSHTNRNLKNGSDVIVPSAGNINSPSSLLVNTWGFRIDGADGFGNGPTITETNVTSSGYTWAGVPANGNAVTIKSANNPATNDQTTIWYGLNASNTKPSGQYTGTVLYTAVAN